MVCRRLVRQVFVGEGEGGGAQLPAHPHVAAGVPAATLPALRCDLRPQHGRGAAAPRSVQDVRSKTEPDKTE